MLQSSFLADVVAGGEFVAYRGLLGRLDGLGCIEFLLAIDELRGNLDAVENGGGLLESDAVIDDGIVDAGHGEWMAAGSSGAGNCKGPYLRWGSAPTV